MYGLAIIPAAFVAYGLSSFVTKLSDSSFMIDLSMYLGMLAVALFALGFFVLVMETPGYESMWGRWR
ncbi:MAG: hypothetical protein P8R42_08820 [Candidatus Binatia bacterium]|nr:hypothetical protein [Candidatus Binatia bacterium]